MRLGLSALTTRLYSQMRGLAKSQQNVQAPDSGTAIAGTIRWASDLGFDSIGISVMSYDQLKSLSRKSVDRICSLCKERSMTIDHIYSAFMSSLIFAKSSLSLETIWDTQASFAKAIGASTIEMLSPPVPGIMDGEPGKEVSNVQSQGIIPWEEVWSRYVSVMKAHARLAERYGLRLAVEPRPKEILQSTDSILRLFDVIGSPHLGAVLDVSHLQVVRENPCLSISKLGKKIFTVHLSDNDGITEWHWAPGQGQIQWEPIIKSLMEAGYGGILSLDVSGIDVEQEIVEGKEYVENLLRATIPLR